MSGDTLHIEQMSLRFNADKDVVHKRIREALQRAPDVVGFTECAAGVMRPVAIDACHAEGYRFHGGPGDTATAVSPEHRVKDHGAIFALAGQPGPAAEGGHGPRYIDWVKFGFHGSDVWFHEAHWVTLHPDTALRHQQHQHMTVLMCAAVDRHGAGDRLSFFGGDTNVDEALDRGAEHWKPHWQFAHHDLTTIYDELHTYPATAGRTTIDIIGSYNPDARVSAEAVHVWPSDAPALDHRQVSGWYTIHRKD